MADAPNITDWIGAISTAVLGVLGTFITAWQWRRSGFNPQLTSRVDARHEAIELLIVNTGRADGIVDQVDVLNPDDSIVEDAAFEGFTEGTFRPLALPAAASMRIIVQAPQGTTFQHRVRLIVGVGATKPQVLTPSVTLPHLGIFGLRSVLPPGTPT
jgi:hypothetical protein